MATDELVPIYIMGKKYRVPSTLTILKAMEYSGYRMIRGCGCRGGVCGACATVYRTADDYRLKVGLACQTVVEPGMYLAQIPFFPANKAKYNIEELAPTAEAIIDQYPELLRCMGCDSCTRVCPQDLKTMEYMSAAMRGDIEKAAELSFECIMCGLCATRCPGDNVQYNVGILARRLYGRHIAPQDKGLAERVEEIEKGEHDNELEELIGDDDDTLRKKYKTAQHDREED
ncbi:MAG: 4Fe-4S dicluster domain-containing protein [Planctomycetes bacterium]|nr:4Fe-4S dicluster domain-containing protein [Planctomycetota bacterium]